MSVSKPIALPLLRALARKYPTSDAALAEIGYLEAVRSLPKGTVHVVSDVHGEYKKLKHIVNNASGTLRPLVERLFAERVSKDEIRDLLSILYYPREAYAWQSARSGFDRRSFLQTTLSREVEIIRELSRGYTLRHAERLFPEALAGLFRELTAARGIEGRHDFTHALVEPFVVAGRDLDLLRAAAHVIRNLSVSEIVVAGDLGDRGPRFDRVVDYLMRQPSVRIVWGNHDASWMGACLGQEALIATVLRISLRYRRLGQLEEGFGLTMAPVEKLARSIYGDDPAEHFRVKGQGLRDDLSMARMQKAMAIIQFKLEGQTSRRHPEYGLEARQLLHRIDPKAGTVTIDGKVHPLLDTHLPTIDFAGDPYALSTDERACMDRLAQSFRESMPLWRAMSWVERQGTMLLRREPAVIFHGCVPVDESGGFRSFVVDGEPRSGRALFDALEHKVRRAFAAARAPAPGTDSATDEVIEHRTPPTSADDLDMFWYLWTGPLSPCFGKDRMATFETHFVADKATHVETKDPYFKLIHDATFCGKVCEELGGDRDRGLIVNGHMPVKIEAGESPVKKSRRAVTIDGAFSEAYGDKGYTLILEAGRTALAQHYHFESVDEAVANGADIIPTVTDVEVYEKPRAVRDTEKGQELEDEIDVLRELLRAFAESLVAEQGPT